MNKVILMGRLTKEPELRQTPNGIASCRFSIAVNRNFKNQQTGQYDADFINCTAWRQTAEFISKYFRKGQMIALDGTLRTGSYQDKNHPDVTHYTTEVFVDNVEFCGNKGNSNTQNTSNAQSTTQAVIDKAQASGIPAINEYEEILSDGDMPF